MTRPWTDEAAPHIDYTNLRDGGNLPREAWWEPLLGNVIWRGIIIAIGFVVLFLASVAVGMVLPL